MTDAQLIGFIAFVTCFFLTLVGMGIYFFARWARNDQLTGRRQKEIEIAQALRARRKRYPTSDDE